MRKLSKRLAATVATGGLLVAAPLAAEGLAGGSLRGFVVGYNASNAQQAIVEQVPEGETVQRWTRMVTTQRFTGLAQRTTPAAYARTILNALPGSCPGAKASPVANRTVSGRPAVQFQVDCPRSAGGAPETFILLAIAGQSNMYVKQVAFRGRIVPADLAWGRSFLSSIVFCTDRDRQPACR